MMTDEEIQMLRRMAIDLEDEFPEAVKEDMVTWKAAEEIQSLRAEVKRLKQE